MKIPVGFNPQGEFGKANFTDENGVTHPVSWDVVLDLPKPATLPTFDTIVRQVYSDVSVLDAVHFKYLNMGHRGMQPARLSDLRKISVNEYLAAVMGEVRWWKDGCPQDDPRLLELRGKPAPPSKKGGAIPDLKLHTDASSRNPSCDQLDVPKRQIASSETAPVCVVGAMQFVSRTSQETVDG